MKFVSLHMIWLFWMIPLGVLFYVLMGMRRKKITEGCIEKKMWPYVVPQWSAFRRGFKQGLILLALLLIITALMRPQWGYELRDIKRKGIDLFVLVDTSDSMLSEDFKPNRMERAKRELIDLLSYLHGDRIGLIVFAGKAFVACPLTTDYATFRLFIDQLDTSMISVQGTDIGGALTTALKTFPAEEGRSRAIILLTDGEETTGGTTAVLNQIREKEVRLYVIGFGSLEGAPIPLPQGNGFKTDREGTIVISKLNESSLQELAKESGGSYVRSVTGDLDIEQIYLKGIKEVLEAKELKNEQKIVGEERFQLPLFLALLILLLEPFVKEAKRGSDSIDWFKLWMRKKIRNFVLFPFFLFVISDTVWAGLAGVEAYQNGNFKEAQKKFEAELQKKPDHPVNHYNLGNSYYRTENYEEAYSHYLNALNLAEDASLREKALYNLGNSAYRLNNLEESIDYYDRVLQLNPENEKARANKEFVENQLKKKEQDKQNQPDQQSDKEKEDNQSTDQSKQSEEKEQNPGENQKPDQNENPVDEKKEEKGEENLKPTVPQLSDKEMQRWIDSLEDNPKGVLKEAIRKEGVPSQDLEKDW